MPRSGPLTYEKIGARPYCCMTARSCIRIVETSSFTRCTSRTYTVPAYTRSTTIADQSLMRAVV